MSNHKPEMTFQELIEHICRRPLMYVIGGTFAMAAAYLDGYDTAVQQFTGQDRNETELGGFRSWLAQRCSGTHVRNLCWQHYIQSLFPDDETAFQQLPILFSQYLSERQQGKQY